MAEWFARPTHEGDWWYFPRKRLKPRKFENKSYRECMYQRRYVHQKHIDEGLFDDNYYLWSPVVYPSLPEAPPPCQRTYKQKRGGRPRR